VNSNPFEEHFGNEEISGRREEKHPNEKDRWFCLVKKQ